MSVLPEVNTPMMRQYRQLKKQYPGVLLLFQLGDFYELFEQDAQVAAQLLNIALTKREAQGQAIPMCGIPCHALHRYLPPLLQAGFHVAICEQMEKPQPGKVVRREVVRLITPGTPLDALDLDPAESIFLCAWARRGGNQGLAACELSTGECFYSSFPSGEEEDVVRWINFFAPRELVADNPDALPPGLRRAIGAHGGAVTRLPEQATPPDPATLEIALEEDPGPAREALALLTAFLQYTQRRPVLHLVFRPLKMAKWMYLDESAKRHLELVESLSAPASGGGTLFSLLRRTRTPLGSRLLRRLILSPSLSIAEIEQRLDAVEEMVVSLPLREGVKEMLAPVGDVERLIGKIALDKASPRDLGVLRRSLSAARKLRSLLSGARARRLSEAALDCGCEALAGELEAALQEDLPPTADEGGLIRAGYSKRIDELKGELEELSRQLAAMEAREREATGIKSLKVSYHQVFGYTIEVTRPNLHLVPPHYRRKQTLAGAERFVTDELKGLEARLDHVRGALADAEREVFEGLLKRCREEAAALRRLAEALAWSDVFRALAEVAVAHNYVRPVVDESLDLHIEEGRHPVLDAACDPFVPNDVHLDDEQRLLLVTGPNMAGKSTYLRQVALITIMAQLGSFVPAKAARIGVVDSIFSRVGAQDEIFHGKSTFLVEMQETARLLHLKRERSLLILDEIGRGTGTYDGLSIAQAVVEYLHDCPERPRTLFATHYLEMTELAKRLPRIRNLTVLVKERGEGIVFLHRILPGAADRSYGIYVARLAGVPTEITKRAEEILRSLERGKEASQTQPAKQPSLFAAGKKTASEALIQKIEKVDPDQLTPRDALAILYELKEAMNDQSEKA